MGLYNNRPLSAEEMISGNIRYEGLQICHDRVFSAESRTDGGISLFYYEAKDNFSKRNDTNISNRIGSGLYGYGGQGFVVWYDEELGYSYSWVEKDSQNLFYKHEKEGIERVLLESKSLGEGVQIGGLVVRNAHKGGSTPTIMAIWEMDGESGIVCLGLEQNYKLFCVPTDFIISLTISPDGERLVWMGWDNPNMPWDENSLWLAQILENLEIQDIRLIAESQENSCYFLPRWNSDNRLYAMKEASLDLGSFWNLHSWHEEQGLWSNLLPISAECGLPQWQSGMSNYDFCSENQVLMSYCRNGRWYLSLCDIQEQTFFELNDHVDNSWCYFDFVVSDQKRVAFLARKSEGKPQLMVAEVGNIASLKNYSYPAKSFQSKKKQSRVKSEIKILSFPAGDLEGSMIYHARARGSSWFEEESEDAPPLLIKVHGGPTAQAIEEEDVRNLYWTSRGMAVCQVNYRGSTGFGREFRTQLYKGWGKTDVEDIRSAARTLVELGLAHPKRIIISGSSAGGLTVLMVLASGDEFCAGVSLYGVCDLESLIKDTHRFEAHYLEKLVGEDRQLYKERSPIYQGDRINKPVLFFQGGQDKIVPVEHSKKMAKLMEEKGLFVKLILFEEEGHGFRRPENIVTSMIEQEKFFRKVLL